MGLFDSIKTVGGAIVDPFTKNPLDALADDGKAFASLVPGLGDAAGKFGGVTGTFKPAKATNKKKPKPAPVDEESVRVQSDATKSLVNWTKAVKGGLASNTGTQIKKKVAAVIIDAESGSNTMLYVGIAAAVLVVGGVIVFAR